LLQGSVQINTQGRYAGFWKKWTEFLVAYFDGHSTGLNVLMGGFEYTEKLDIVLAFLAFLHTGSKKLKQSTIANTLSGVKFTFQLNRGDASCFEDVLVGKMMRSLQLKDAKDGITVHKKRPIPLEMTLRMLTKVLKTDAKNDEVARVAILMAYYCMLRQSEYIFQSGDQNHAIQAQDVDFHMAATDLFVSATAPFTVSYDEIDAVRISLRSCKNDPFRQGNVFWFHKQNMMDRNLDIVAHMHAWARRANLSSTDVFTSYRVLTDNSRYVLTYKRMQQLIRITALQADLDPAEFGTHSWRISGATTLEAGGMSLEQIKLLGRWKSLTTVKGYDQPNSAAFERAQTILSNPTIFPMSDLSFLSVKARKGTGNKKKEEGK